MPLTSTVTEGVVPKGTEKQLFKLLLACACVWIAVGCTGRPDRAHAAAPAESAASSASELQPPAPVPDVPLTLQDGFRLQLPLMKGKIIAVFFCAAHDDPECRREVRVLGEHHAELHDEHHVVLIGVSPATTSAQKAFLSAQHSPLDFASDPDGRVARAFGVAAPQPGLRMFVVGKDGTLRAVWHGSDPERHVQLLLDAARE